MKILSVAIHNFRSIQDATVWLRGCTLLVGPNNAGKSNFLDALRVFYEDAKYVAKDDFCKCEGCDLECWIDVEFALSDTEHDNLKSEYRSERHILKLRKYLQTSEKGPDGKPKSGIYAHSDHGVSESRFYGWKNVGQGKLGKVIFVPAVSRLSEQTKLTGPSPLRDILDEILKGIATGSDALKKLGADLDQFSVGVKSETTLDGRSLSGLEAAINSAIADWDAKFVLTVDQMSPGDILKNLIGFRIKDGALDAELEADQFGEGFQRQLLFSLLQIASEYAMAGEKPDKKEFAGDLTLLLFEEPEAFLHPAQQSALAGTLRTLGAREGFQVLTSTHSPAFVSRNVEDIPGIARVSRIGAKTVINQLTQEGLDAILSENQELDRRLRAAGKDDEADAAASELESVRYMLWLDANRCALFFADHVLLVEGSSDRAVIDYLLGTGEITPGASCYVCDCLGKWNIHRFMNLLGALRVSHSVLYDDDNGKHPERTQFISESRNECTALVDWHAKDLEAALGLQGVDRRKAESALLALRLESIDPVMRAEFVAKVEPLVLA